MKRMDAGLKRQHKKKNPPLLVDQRERSGTVGELDRLRVVMGLEEVRARLRAIESAKLSVTSNEKSFGVGVRTQLDVLNSVETLYVVNQQYIESVIELGRNYLKLCNSAALPATDTVQQVRQILFQK